MITALIIMAIAVSLAATLAYRQQVSIRLAGNLGALEQAYQYATGMEDWAGDILTKDLKDSNKDALDEDWATLLPPIPIPGGHMKGQLFDLQARVNLNDVLSVVTKNGQKSQLPNKLQIDILTRLYKKLGFTGIDELRDSLIDWIDVDEQERDKGAESGHYKTLERSYLSANSTLASVSELRLIKGYDKEIEIDQGDNDEPATKTTVFQKLSPYVNVLPALPEPRTIKINVNTASSEVLSSLGLSPNVVRNAIEAREVESFNSVNDFLREVGIDANNKTFPKNRLSVDSHYFLLQGIVEIGRVRLFVNSTIQRDSTGRTRVIHREFNQT